MWEERFTTDEETDEKEFDSFAGTEVSKMFGIYTDVQAFEYDIEQVHDSGKVVLLQIGQGDFNDEGVFTVLIPESDLRERDFRNCTVIWSQT
jgi:uncharacterized protein YwqG